MDETFRKDLNEAIPHNGAKWGEPSNWYWKGIRCHWRVLGRDNHKPILLLHGFGASSSHWRNNAGPLAAAGFRVYSLDLIGFGESEQPNQKKIPKIDNQFWAEQVAAFLEQIIETDKFGKAILIGNSLGSLTALTTLCFRSELISAVVASPLPDPAFMQQNIFTPPFWLKKLHGYLTRIFFHLLPLEIFVPLIARTNLIKIALQGAYHHSIRFDKELHQIVARPARKPSAARALRSMCIGMATRPPKVTAPVLLEELSRKNNPSPVLLIWGKQDKLVPFNLGKRLAKKHPWLNLFELDKTGHCPHDESPTQFNQIVLNWLATNLEGNQQQA